MEGDVDEVDQAPPSGAVQSFGDRLVEGAAQRARPRLLLGRDTGALDQQVGSVGDLSGQGGPYGREAGRCVDQALVHDEVAGRRGAAGRPQGVEVAAEPDGRQGVVLQQDDEGAQFAGQAQADEQQRQFEAVAALLRYLGGGPDDLLGGVEATEVDRGGLVAQPLRGESVVDRPDGGAAVRRALEVRRAR
ncbi:hypothetical protein [Streptomyces sp. NBC_00158]|uniref:hypothetical protein n=1 Tax=Streptomyces sp. NBC_00158 TaxID=2903627 RepID=UPI0032473659